MLIIPHAQVHGNTTQQLQHLRYIAHALTIPKTLSMGLPIAAIIGVKPILARYARKMLIALLLLGFTVAMARVLMLTAQILPHLVKARGSTSSLLLIQVVQVILEEAVVVQVRCMPVSPMMNAQETTNAVLSTQLLTIQIASLAPSAEIRQMKLTIKQFMIFMMVRSLAWLNYQLQWLLQSEQSSAS